LTHFMVSGVTSLSSTPSILLLRFDQVFGFIGLSLYGEWPADC
jgi:hypothetical protein